EKTGKLLGIPFTVKDLYLVDGTKTTFASKLMEDFIAPYTSTIVQKCLDEGAILIGKCNCDPWGFGGSGENSGYGPTKHPLDFTKTPGGSSSGSAASLLAGVGYFSLGTDTGGSIRLPASFCGLYGIKPTYGRNSRFGIGAMGSSFDTPGFLTRNVEDMELVESIIAGKDINDATTYDIPFNSQPVTPNPQVRIGIPKEFFGEGLSPEIKTEIDKKIEELKSLGHEVKEVSIPSTKYGLPVYYVLVPSEISSNRARYDGVRFGKKVSDNYEENLVQSRSKYLEDEVKRRIMVGTYALSKGYADQFYKQASKVRTKLKKEFDKVFEEVDVLITPVSPTTAFKLGEKSQDPVQMYLVDIYTVTANLVGIPSLAIPIGKDKDGMPIGMQAMGKKWSEVSLFNLAKELS
ncbi:MAG: Asp-tRNA(Asn)/Glu-tRNA(Gln) amidotransferase subunit GatA, partial [Candidatus Dojkabacteria bacterium]